MGTCATKLFVFDGTVCNKIIDIRWDREQQNYLYTMGPGATKLFAFDGTVSNNVISIRWDS